MTAKSSASVGITRGSHTWYLYLMLAIVGYGQSILGSIAPFLRDELAFSKVEIGWHFSIYALGMFVAGRLVQWGQGRFQADRILLGSVTLLVLSIGLLGFPMPIAGTMICALFVGLGVGAAQVTIPAGLARHHGDNQGIAMAEAFVFGALGVFLGPLVIGFAVRFGFEWRETLIVPLILLAIVLLIFRHARVSDVSLQGAYAGKAEASGLPIAAIVVLCMVFLGIATEWGVAFWGAQFIEVHLGVAPETGVAMMSAFFGGTLVGRFFASRLLTLFSVRRMLIVVIFVGSASLFVLTAVPLFFVAVPMLALAGMCLGNFFPLILSIAIESARDRPGRISSGATQAVGLALLIVPVVLGQVGTVIGLEKAIGMLAFLPLLMLVLYGVSTRLAPQSSRG